MKPDEIKEWLSEEEWENYHAVCEMLKITTNRSIPDMDFLTDQKSALESLAACRKRSEQRRVLMEKHEWVESPINRYAYMCMECGHETHQTTLTLKNALIQYPDTFIHAPGCLWAQAIKGE